MEDPWRDDRTPSLIAADGDGRLIGFIGSQTRRVRYEDRELHAVSVSHLTVAADSRRGVEGARLFRRLLTAGQDFTISDTANETVAAMWRNLGGDVDHARACDWMLVLKPVRWLRDLGSYGLRRRRGRTVIPVGALPFRALRLREASRALEPDPAVTADDVDAATIVENLPEMAHGLRLWVDYDEPFLNYVFSEMETKFGRLVRRMVRRRDHPVGWYAYVPNRHGVSRVLHVHAAERHADAVVAELIGHAKAQDSAVISGRLEPHLTAALRRLVPVLAFARQPVVHASDPEIRATLAGAGSVLTQLDSEWFVM